MNEAGGRAEAAADRATQVPTDLIFVVEVGSAVFSHLLLSRYLMPTWSSDQQPEACSRAASCAIHHRRLNYRPGEPNTAFACSTAEASSRSPRHFNEGRLASCTNSLSAPSTLVLTSHAGAVGEVVASSQRSAVRRTFQAPPPSPTATKRTEVPGGRSKPLSAFGRQWTAVARAGAIK